VRSLVVVWLRASILFLKNRKFFKGYCALYGMLYDQVIDFLKKDDGPCTQREIAMALPAMNRAILLGYLRCLVDSGKIRSKDNGKAKAYFL